MDLNKIIFVSHRWIDREFVNKLTDYLAILGIPQNAIFCSSLPGNDVDAKISDEIRLNFDNSIMNIVILSPEYYKSAYCLNEAGIIWYQAKPTIVIALPGIDEKNMYGFLNGDFKIRRLTDKEDLLYIHDKISSALDITKPNIQTLSKKTTEYVSLFETMLSTIPVEVADANNDVEDLTDDEKILLYYFAKKNKKVLDIDDTKVAFRDAEIVGVDIDNGLSLLAECGFGSLGQFSFDIEMSHFRKMKEYLKNEHILDCVKKHIAYRRDTFLKLYSEGQLTDNDMLFVLYVNETKSKTFGDRWMAEAEIRSIKKWESDNDLDNSLSTSYLECLQKFVNNDLCYSSDFTSHGNPREYTLYQSLYDFFTKPNDLIKTRLQDVKSKHKVDFPF